MVSDWGKHYIKRWLVATTMFVICYVLIYILLYQQGHEGISIICWITGSFLYIFSADYFEIKKAYRVWRSKKEEK